MQSVRIGFSSALVQVARERNHASLGVAYFMQGRNEDAIKTFQRITEIQPDSAWGFQQLGTAYHARGDLDAALANYLKAIERGPTAQAHSNIGMIYYTRQNFAEAERAFEQTVKLDSTNAVTWRTWETPTPASQSTKIHAMPMPRR